MLQKEPCPAQPAASYHSPGAGGEGTGLCMRSQSGRRLCIGGSQSKFSGGGGELVAHSRVHACQGLGPAVFPFIMLYIRFKMNSMIEKASRKTDKLENKCNEDINGRPCG